MNITLDTILPIVGLLVTLAIPTVGAIASYRLARPYRIVGHCIDTGMVKVRWRDEPNRTYIYTRARLAAVTQGRATR
ncbi:hypothetical protein [Nonomuraea sp. SYSU D8015]|uniref:hypothetical protein n=1 Tax=Nonomuraea sp. SYSU D8015 TaxID=2593644 RepID=UPI001660C2D8|nr:hypothetical protein [Nonomuraea sp. SYSU D8015]